MWLPDFSLSPDSLINPHRNILGLGNYDINVIMAALQLHGYQTVWFDRRKYVKLLLRFLVYRIV